ncbi:MAG: SMP-30/gluconolactonase/LRE family protein [Candidatus Nanopelagicales bacterium]
MSKPSIHPVKWEPPASAESLPPANLPPLHVLPVPGHGPEDPLFLGDAILTGVDDGRIVKVSLDGWQIEVLADTKGRPLGLEQYTDGRVLICDAERGLLLLDPATGDLETLVAVGQHGLRLCNNAAVATDGTIYFSDSSQRFELEHWTADLLEHSGTGRLLRRNPDGTVDVLAEGLQFANGVALTDEFVVVAQTGDYSLTRIWLDTGRTEQWITNLPGFPDNISNGDDGLLWVAMASARKSALDGLPAKIPLLRKAIWALPEALHPKPDTMTWLRAYDVQGTMVHEFFGEHDDFFMVTGVRVAGDKVALGSLNTTTLAWFELPAVG